MTPTEANEMIAREFDETWHWDGPDVDFAAPEHLLWLLAWARRQDWWPAVMDTAASFMTDWMYNDSDREPGLWIRDLIAEAIAPQPSRKAASRPAGAKRRPRP